MRRRLWAPGAILGLLLVTAVGSVGQAPSLQPGSTGGPLAQLPFGGAQTGVAPQPFSLGVLPGQETRLALYCVDLFNDTPTDRHEFSTAADPRAVVVAAGEQMSLQEAIAAGFLSVRGHDPVSDPPRRDGRQWIDLYLTNHTRTPVHVSYPAGFAFVPKGRAAPALAAGMVRMLETAYEARLTGSDTLAYAMWASRGFTRRDVEETQLRPIPDEEAAVVQKLLDAGGIAQRFDRESGAYKELLAKREQNLGDEPQPIQGAATLASGARLTVTGKRNAAGRAVVALQPARSTDPLYYEARVRTVRNGRMELELIHLKTGKLVPVYDGKLSVRLTAG
jgi:hypothetical protein